MTQKEIDKFLANTKVYVNGKSKEIQEKLFSLGYCWPGKNSTEVEYEGAPFLYIDNNHHISYGRDMVNFSNHKNREITAEEILSIELTEPKYRPFKNQEECWNEMHKHPDFGWVYYKKNKYYVNISTMGDYVGMNGQKFDSAFENYTFTDGTPFGIKKE